jgi:hypothetical protein
MGRRMSPDAPDSPDSPDDTSAPSHRPGLGRFCELLALWGLTVAQPVLDSFAGSPETFVYRRASTTDIVLFAIEVTFLVPVALWLVERIVSRWSDRLAAGLHVVFLAALFGIAGWQLVERHTGWPREAHLAVGLLLAVVGTVLVTRYRPPRTVLRFLAVSPVLVTALWLGTGPVHEVAFADGPDTTRGAPVGNPAPIVMVVLDELPTASLLDADGRIDETLWPGFARLAADGTWYRNTSSVSPTTPEAVPAILTGRYPGELDVPPTAASHPHNLFRALQGSYELNVWELVAQLCPPAQCPALGGAVDQGLGALVNDAGDLWLDYMDEPPATEEEAFAIRQSDPEAPRKFEQFIASIEDTEEPRLDFIHIALPHQPWRHLPSGARHDAPFLAEGLGEPNYSWKSPYFAEAARQRHLLQLQRADALLAQLLQRLDDLGRYEESLIVVTADHGVAFDADEPIRGLSEANAEQVMWVPLFVKEPGQVDGVVDDRPVQTVDVFPTIVDIIDLDLPWSVDGRPASEARTTADETRRFYPWRLNELAPDDSDHVEVDGTSTFSALLALTPPGSEPRDDLQLYRFGEWGSLVGTEVEGLDVSDAAPEVVVELLDADGRVVGPDHFDVTLGQEVLPVYVRGQRASGDPPNGPAPRPVVLAVNGFVAGWGQWFPKEGDDQFFVLAPQQLFAEGVNSLKLYEVDGTPEEPLLHPIEIDWP